MVDSNQELLRYFNSKAGSAARDDRASSALTQQLTDNTKITSSVVGAPASVASSSANTSQNKKGIENKSNILHNYVNWTYHLGLYMLDVGAYNSFVSSGQISQSQLNHPILKSGGFAKGGDGLDKDLYINEFNMESVFGNNKFTPYTNNFSLKMSVVEPYGAYFMGSLEQLSIKLNGSNSIFTETPYLIEIDFMGYTDAGKYELSILTKDSKGKKYIPVKLISIDMQLESAGARYIMSFVPYPMSVFLSDSAQVPVSIRTKGKTVNDLLSSEYGLMTTLNNLENAWVQNKLVEKANKYTVSIGKTATNPNQITMLDATYEFPLGSANAGGGSGGPGGPNGPNSGSSGQATYIWSRDENDPTSTSITITGKTLVKDGIAKIIRSSNYFDSKTTPTAPDSNSNPGETLKIIPFVKLLEWDKARQEYAKDITYIATAYYNYGDKHPHNGQAEVQERGWVKEYNYIFTGKNQDIIRLDLTFNNLYYTRITPSLGDKLSQLIGTLTPSEIDTNRKDLASYVANKIKIAEHPSQGVDIVKTNQTMSAVSYMDMKLNSPTNVDMLQLEMEIIGDPDWIPQDRSIRPKGTELKSDILDEYGGVSIDVNGVYVNLKFRTPRDISDQTGLMEIDASAQNYIQGIYQVWGVDHTFGGGKFTQKLKMTRVINQPENNPAGALGSQQRTDYNNRVGRGGAIPQNPAVNISTQGNN